MRFSRIYRIVVTALGLLMFAFVFGLGPTLFPGHDPNPKHVYSDAGERLLRTQAKVVTTDIRPAKEKTWRNYVSSFFMLEPVDMVSVPEPKRTELQRLQARARGAGSMTVYQTDY